MSRRSAAVLLADIRWNPALKALYRRLTQRGKAHTAALIVCARKTLFFAKTVVASDTPWTDLPAAT